MLDLAPAEWLYRQVFRLVGLAMPPTAEAAALPLVVRALKRRAWKFVIPRLPALKTRYPRLVMPSGYVDRELSLRTLAHRYLSVNAMDFLRIACRLPQDAKLRRIAGDAVSYAFENGIETKWREQTAVAGICHRLLVLLRHTLMVNPHTVAWVPRKPDLRALLRRRSSIGLGTILLQRDYPALCVVVKADSSMQRRYWKARERILELDILTRLDLCALAVRHREDARNASVRSSVGRGSAGSCPFSRALMPPHWKFSWRPPVNFRKASWWSQYRTTCPPDTGRIAGTFVRSNNLEPAITITKVAGLSA